MKTQKKTNKDTFSSIFSSSKGFTLLELLVVVLIIGILASIALPQYQNSVTKAEFAEAYIKLKAAAQIEELCRLQNGTESCNDESYLEQINTEINGCQSNDCEDFDWGYGYNTFYYHNSLMSSGPILASAQYLKEDVCVCITEDYKFVLAQDGCSDTPNKDYSKILGIPDITSDGHCHCC